MEAFGISKFISEMYYEIYFEIVIVGVIIFGIYLKYLSKRNRQVAIKRDARRLMQAVVNTFHMYPDHRDAVMAGLMHCYIVGGEIFITDSVEDYTQAMNNSDVDVFFLSNIELPRIYCSYIPAQPQTPPDLRTVHHFIYVPRE